MADNGFNATISADGSKFTKTLAQLEAQLKAFQNALKNANNPESFARLQRAADATKGRIDALKNSGTAVSSGLDKARKSSDQATQALGNLSRVAQDAPYGFIGIANNLNPLLESFQRLQASTGSTGGALKALVGSLSGAGGIGLALGVVSSLAVVFGDTLFGSKKATQEADAALKVYTDTIDSAKHSIDDLVSSIQFANKLGGINTKIFGFGKDIGNELQDLREQSVAQQDLVGSLEKAERDAYALYLKSFNDLTLSEENQKKAREDALKDYQETQKKAEDARKDGRVIYREIELQKLQDQEAANKKAKDLNDKLVRDTIARAKELADYLDSHSIRAIQFEVDPRDSIAEQYTKALQFIQKTADTRGNFRIKQNLDFQLGDIRFPDSDLSKSIAEESPKLKEKIEKEIADLSKRNPIVLEMNAVLSKFYLVEAQLKAATDQLNKSIQSAFVNGVQGLAESIGQAFAGEDIGKAVINVIGDFLIQVGKALIQFGITVGLLNKVLNNPLNPVSPLLALAGGIAAVAAGALLKSTVKGHRAFGGTVNAGDGYLVGERGPERFVPNVSGSIVPNSALTGRAASGGGIQVSGQFRISGNDLIAVLSRSSRQQGRLS